MAERDDLVRTLRFDKPAKGRRRTSPHSGDAPKG